MAKKDKKVEIPEEVKKVEEVKAEAPAAPKEEPKPEKKPEKVDEKDEAAEAILKAHPQYKELYIDDKGGIFAPGTPDFIRGNAKLYKNKYYKQ